MPHNGSALDHACGRIAQVVKDKHGVEVSDQEVEDVITNHSTRRDLAFEIEMTILLEAMGYPIAIAAVAPRAGRVGNASTPSSGSGSLA